jgi:hypothetical protein
MWVTTDCDRDFVSEAARLSHYANSKSHHWCSLCETDFNNQSELCGHLDEEHCRCPECNCIFATRRGMDEHARQSHHYCMQHARFFKNQNGLDNVSL